MVRRSVLPIAVGVVLLLTATFLATSPNVPGHGRLGPAAPAGAGALGGSSGGTVGANSGGSGNAHPLVSSAGRHDVSKPLRSVTPGRPEPGEDDADAAAPLPLPGRAGSVSRGGRDPVVQATPVSGASVATVGANFDGVTNINSVLPPDTNGDIGPNDYVQWVNLSFAIYNRSGTLLYGPAAGNTLWNNFGGPCQTTNNGDPIAQYDHLADRWVMSQFALPNYPSGPFYECIAVSTTGDPLGTWYRYEFKISDTKLDDYPHLGVWSDGYYMSINQFLGNSWGGAGAVAFERARMLQGLSAKMVYFDLFGVDPNLGGMLPSDLDGPAPPNGAPNVFAEADDGANGYPQDQLDLWDFHVDWVTPANSTFSHDASLATAAMDTNMCGYARNCIPQPKPAGPAVPGLDALSDRIMYRLQYRNFGGYHTLVTTQTVDVDGTNHAGIRWFEVRDSGSGWAIRQQGTWAPDANNRWLGSAAMDGTGDIAIGYSVSSATVFPSIRFAGRLAADPLGTLGVAEGSIIAGTGSQTSSASRWGDYSMLAVDPNDDCTFWYTSEYMLTTSNAPWRTRIAAIQLPGCGGGDQTPPAVSTFGPTTATPTNAPTISYGLTFSESVTGLAAGDFGRTGTATGCSVGAPSGSGASYTIAVTGCSEGTVILTLNSGTVTDLATNAGPTSPSTASTVTIDRTGPTATLTPPASPTNATTLSYTAAFNESVTGVAAGDFAVTGTATGCVVGAPSGSGTSRTVGLTGCSGGTVVLTLNSGSVTDTAGNPGPASNVAAASVTVDRTAPTATLTPPASPTSAATLTYGVGFDESVTGLAAGDFTRTGTATGCTVGAPSGSAASYTVAVTGCSNGTVVLTLNAATVADLAGNPGPASDVAASSVLISRSGPSVTTFAPSTASPTNAATVSYNLTFDVSVTGLAAGDFTRTGTATGCTVGAPAGSGASYTVAVTGCSNGTLSLTLNANTVADLASNLGPASPSTASTVSIDRTVPTTGAPSASLRSGVVLGGASLPVALAWTAADTGGSGLATYDVARSLDGAAFTTIATGLASPAFNTTTSSSHTYRFEVRAHDHAGNIGGWVAGSTLKPSLVQQTSASITYHLTWTSSTYASYSGGTLKYATAAGAYATYTFTGRGVAFVTTRAASRGQAKIYLDGVLITTIDCYAPTSTFRYVAYAKTWATVGTHRITIKLVGTVGRQRVDLDAIEVMR